MDDSRRLLMSSFRVDYPFADRLYPGAHDAVARVACGAGREDGGGRQGSQYGLPDGCSDLMNRLTKATPEEGGDPRVMCRGVLKKAAAESRGLRLCR